ncbi:nuclear pore complex protein NUP1-like isoform X2 [Gossypium australe]|uniref:Nuclear pore complex protein NUP1-like isoform X2 n=1 Tax=Gossypium australe TaxID=47621 RepID=A0A5B6V647_9ROSI|nr:nuclear pore complex protein NUP1-like isoform X2 [Gossypium australe]
MATAREEGNPCDGAQGPGGKFKKWPFRRTTKTTPYDRPPTSIRNPSSSSNENGWLSKLVDPARRLITSSAHRLLASVFTKRLPPPPPPTPQLLDSGDIIECENPTNHSDKGGVAELEEILKQKTFTRQDDLNLSEIDLLTSLLRSRTVDITGGNEEKRSERISVVSHDKKEDFLETPVRENGTENHLISTPVAKLTVPDEDVASPAELAKAYMGSRPSKVSTSMHGLQNQVPRRDLSSPSNRIFPCKSSMMSLVPRSSGHVGSLGNGFMTPRSRGRSAIYSMARTPYSRVNSSTLIKSAGTDSDAFGGPLSSSQGTWEHNRISGSGQGVLKRRSSVLDNDIGSVGPIRRICQKSSFLSSRNLTLPASVAPLSVHVVGTSSAGLDTLAVTGGNSSPGTSFTTVPSKSSQMASKIFQQLEMLVSPGEKSPSMLHGQARKNLANVDSPKFLENVQDSSKVSGSRIVLTDFQDSVSNEHDKVKKNVSTLVSLPDKQVPAVNGVDSNSLMKDNRPSVRAADSSGIKSVIQLSQEKSQAFQMSAHEDYLDLDGGDYSIGATPARFGEWRDRSDNSVNGSKRAAPEAVVEKPSIFSEVMPISSAAVNRNPGMRTSNGSPVVEKNSSITFPVVQVANSSVQSAFLGSQSTQAAKEDAFSTESSAPPMVSIGEKVAPVQSDAAVTTFGFASRNVGEVLSITGSSGVKLAKSSDQELDYSSSFATAAPGVTNHLSEKTDRGSTMNGIFRTPETALTSAVSTSNFKFGASADGSAVNNGSFSSSSFSFSSPVPSLVPSNGRNSSSATATNNDSPATATTSASATVNPTICHTSIPSVETSIPSFTASPVFKFSSSGDPSTSGEATKSMTQDTSPGNVGIFPSSSTFAFTCSGSSAVSSTTGTTAVFSSSGNSCFSGTSSTITNSGSGFFSSTFTTVMGTGSSIFGSSSSTISTGSSIFGGTSLPVAGTGNSTFSTKSAITGSGSNIFGFGAPAAPTSTALTQGLNPFNAADTQASAAGTGIETNSLSSSSGIAAGAFGSSWQAPKTATFGSSSGFSFGSSTSVSAPSSAPIIFRSSTGASSISVFSFTSAAAATSSQPVFGNTSPGLVFGSTPASNNDQMEDSMAEDTVLASPAVVTCSQQPISSPVSGFVFGASNPSGASPVQFGGQTSIGATQNPSPFLASGSVEFGAGGSFSLGTGGSDKSARKFVKESNPYDGGLGAGGKFRKRPFRRTTKTTPYDRPATSIRNPSGSGDRNGWLSRLVDPARRLITSSAHRLFASVFTKRLPPPPPQTPQALESGSFCCARSHHRISEIDHLTSLLCSRSADIPGGNEEKRPELTSVVSHDKKEEFPKTPVREHVTENHLISTPVVGSTVIDDVVASPAELAKAYMGSRTPKVSVSRLGLQNQVPRGDLTCPSNKNFPSMSSTMSLVPRSSGHVGNLGNSFVTPRLRGRSAIYSMARTPYSRVNSSTLLKSSGTASDAFGGPSSTSQSAWEQKRISGSTQGVSKRRSSVLDNDIGSVGPIRRIRQKSNLLSSRNLSLPTSAGPSAHIAGNSSAALDTLAENGDNSSAGTSVTTVPSKSSQTASKILQQLDMMVSPREKSPTKLSPSMLRGQALKSIENVDSSKFLENMQDTDKLSTALPAVCESMSGKHDKAKENGSTMMVALPDKAVPAVNGADSNSLIKDNNMPSVKASDSSAIKSIVPQPQQKSRAFQMSAHEDYLDLDDDDYPNGVTPAEGRGRLDNCVMESKSAAPEAMIEKASSPEVIPNSSAAFNQKPDLKTSDGPTGVEKNAGITSPVVEVAISSLQSPFFVSSSIPIANRDVVPSQSNAPHMLSIGEKVVEAKQSNGAVTSFGFASTNVGEVSYVTGSSGVKLATSSDQKPENLSSCATTAPGTTNYLSDKTDKESNLNGIFCRTPETAITSSVSTSISAGSKFKFGASAADGSTFNNGSCASSPFSFSSPAPSPVPSNCQSSSSATATKNDTSAATITSASATANASISFTSSPSVEASIPSFTGAPVFNIFGSTSAASSSAGTTAEVASSGNSSSSGISSTSTNSGSGFFSSTFSPVTSTGNGIFGGTSASTSTGNGIFGGTSATTSTGTGLFGGTSAATSTGNGIFGGKSATSTGSSIFGGTSLPVCGTGSIFSTKTAGTATGSNVFGFSAPATSTSTSQSQGINPFNAVNSQASAAGTGIGTSSQSTPIQFSSSASSPSFGLAGNATFSSGSSIFGSSASVAKPFSSGSSFGISSSSSETKSLSSSSGIAGGAFGSTWQAPKTPTFGSSSGFSFGSSTSVSAPSGTSTIFGSSTGASSSSIFSFTSAAAATPSQPVFGNTSPGLVFGSTPSSNNDQMEDSMAEDTVQASPAVVTFSQQPISPPASGFVFGASNPPAAGSVPFGTQPSMAAPQNPSPFLASGSLEFGGGGSFSLGTSGGDKSARKYVKVRKQRKK